MSRGAKSTLPEHDCFTVLFRGDLRNYEGNPFEAETPFGHPACVGVGDAMQRVDDAVEETSRLLEALRSCRLELFWCAKQLEQRGVKGHPEDSVSRAIRLADHVIAGATT